MEPARARLFELVEREIKRLRDHIDQVAACPDDSPLFPTFDNSDIELLADYLEKVGLGPDGRRIVEGCQHLVDQGTGIAHARMGYENEDFACLPSFPSVPRPESIDGAINYLNWRAGEVLRWLEDVRQQILKSQPVAETGSNGPPPQPPRPRPDGPEAPQSVWLNGEEHRVASRRSFQLLELFWSTQKKAATRGDLEVIWPERVGDTTYSTAASRFNVDMPPKFPFTLHWDGIHGLIHKKAREDLHKNFTA